MIRRIAGVAAALLVSAFLSAGAADAAPVIPVPSLTGGAQLSVGPIPIPAASLKVCVDGTCRTATGVTSLTVTLKGSATLLGVPPLLLPVACSSGVGIGVKTLPGSLGTVTGSLTLATSNGTVTVPVNQAVSTTHGLTVTACTV